MTTWLEFWFRPADPLALRIVRTAIAAIVAIWMLSFAGHAEWAGRRGPVDDVMYREANGTTVEFRHGVNNPQRVVVARWNPLFALPKADGVMTTLWFVTLAAALLTIAGVATRLTVPVMWFGVVGFASNPLLSSAGGEGFLKVAAFYVMIATLVAGWRSSADVLGAQGDFLPRFGERGGESSLVAFVLRLWQLHFGILVVLCGLHKLQSAAWWGGMEWFYWLHPTDQLDSGKVIALRPGAGATMAIMSLLTYVTLAWQIGFPAFAWRRGGWTLAVGGGVIGFVGAWYIYGAPLLGAVWALGGLSFVPPDVWRARLGRQNRDDWQDAPARLAS